MIHSMIFDTEGRKGGTYKQEIHETSRRQLAKHRPISNKISNYIIVITLNQKELSG